jgi:hypothetical protein
MKGTERPEKALPERRGRAFPKKPQAETGRSVQNWAQLRLAVGLPVQHPRLTILETVDFWADLPMDQGLFQPDAGGRA